MTWRQMRCFWVVALWSRTQFNLVLVFSSEWLSSVLFDAATLTVICPDTRRVLIFDKLFWRRPFRSRYFNWGRSYRFAKKAVSVRIVACGTWLKRVVFNYAPGCFCEWETWIVDLMLTCWSQFSVHCSQSHTLRMRQIAVSLSLVQHHNFAFASSKRF